MRKYYPVYNGMYTLSADFFQEKRLSRRRFAGGSVAQVEADQTVVTTTTWVSSIE